VLLFEIQERTLAICCVSLSVGRRSSWTLIKRCLAPGCRPRLARADTFGPPFARSACQSGSCDTRHRRVLHAQPCGRRASSASPRNHSPRGENGCVVCVCAHTHSGNAAHNAAPQAATRGRAAARAAPPTRQLPCCVGGATTHCNTRRCPAYCTAVAAAVPALPCSCGCCWCCCATAAAPPSSLPPCGCLHSYVCAGR
jgi:hypothetical protein